MEFVVGTFVLVIAIVGGLYWLVVERPDAQEETAVRKRLRRVAGKSTLVTKAIAKDQERLSDLGAFDRVLTKAGDIVGPLQLMIQQAGLKITVGTVLLSCAVAAALTFAFFSIYLGLPLVAIAFAAVAAYLPIGSIRWMRSRRMILRRLA